MASAPLASSALHGVGAAERRGEHQRRLAVGGFHRVEVGAGVGQRRRRPRRCPRPRRASAASCRWRSARSPARRPWPAAPTTAARPFWVARWSGVKPPMRVVARELAPASSSISASARVAVHRRPMQRGHAVALRGVGVGAALEQLPHRGGVAGHGRVGHRAAAVCACSSADAATVATARPASRRTRAAVIAQRLSTVVSATPLRSISALLSPKPASSTSKVRSMLEHRVGHRRAVGGA